MRNLYLALVLFGMMLTATGNVACAAAENRQPNIVLIISDDQAWGDYSFMGHPHIQTPHIDRLAAQSLTFRRGYVPDSLCRPSLATMITGLYPHQHGITGNDPARTKGAGQAAYADLRRKLISRIDDVPTLPRLLAAKGYLSMQTGKWWEGNYKRGGFTHGMTQGFGNHPRGRHGDDGLKIGREGLKPIFDFVDTARKQNKPFFVWHAPFLPHTPHNPPERLLKKYIDKTPSKFVAQYWAMCEWFDETCGELLKYLDDNDLADNTIVLYVCDNGWIQNPQGRFYAQRSKRSPYEGGVRTPIMVRWPGKVQPKMDDQTLASSIDLAPTILTACGLKPTDDMHGANLLDTEALSQRKTIYGETLAHDVADIDRPTLSLTSRWIIDGNWKLIKPHADKSGESKAELYDLAADPHEKNDAAGNQPQKVERLQGKLDAWWPGPR